jgi:hypothetical protein
MQTCSRCSTQSPDNVILCVKCQSDLRVFSTTSVALHVFKKNPRIMYVRISIGNDACPSCHAQQGTYPKENVPILPHQGCSHENGCRCFYEPFLGELFP